MATDEEETLAGMHREIDAMLEEAGGEVFVVEQRDHVMTADLWDALWPRLRALGYGVEPVRGGSRVTKPMRRPGA